MKSLKLTDRVKATYVLQRGDEATEEHSTRQSRQTVSKCARHSSPRAVLSHKRACKGPEAEAPPRETLRPEAGLEPIFSRAKTPMEKKRKTEC